MVACRSVIMEAFRGRFTGAELLSYKEVLYVEATEASVASSRRVVCTVRSRRSGNFRMQLYAVNPTVLSPCGRVQRTVFHPCTLSITNAERSNTSRKVALARLLYVTVG